MLILISGLPATGKSTVARKIARSIGAEVLRTDIIRRELVKNPRYTEEEKDLIYNTVFLLTDYLIKHDVNVIIDGTFYKEYLRRQAKGLAKKRGKRFFLIETRCPEDVVLKRLKQRERNIRSPSDADIKVYYKIKELYEEIKDDHIIIDTGWNIQRSIKEVIDKIKS